MRERLEFAHPRIVEAADQPARAHVRIGEDLGDSRSPGRPARRPRRARQRCRRGCALANRGGELRHDLVALLAPDRRCRQHGSLPHSSSPSALHSGAQCWSLAVMCAYLPSLQRKVAEGTRPGCSVPSRGGTSPNAKYRAAASVSSATWPSSMEKSTWQPLPVRCAPGERGQDGDRDPQAGSQVGDRQAGLHRAAAPLAGQAHDAAHRLEHGVVALLLRVRARLAEAGARDVDDALVERRRATDSPARSARACRPGKFSSTTSAFCARSRMIFWPSAERRLTVIDSLERLQAK